MYTNNNTEVSAPLKTFEGTIKLENGIILKKKYFRGRMLGKGGFAECYECMDQETEEVIAAKIIKKDFLVKNNVRQKVDSEINIHKNLVHPNVVEFKYFMQDKYNLYIMLELCKDQTLHDIVKQRKQLTEYEVKHYLIQIIEGIEYIHSNGIIHRDLKLGNLFLDHNNNIKIGDFGLAAQLEYENQRRRTVCGTPNYIAPEVLKQTGHSFEVDIWAVGIIMFTLLCGKPPFEGSTPDNTHKNVLANRLTFPDHINISGQAKNLITTILNPNPSLRPALSKILAHPFFDQGDQTSRELSELNNTDYSVEHNINSLASREKIPSKVAITARKSTSDTPQTKRLQLNNTQSQALKDLVTMKFTPEIIKSDYMDNDLYNKISTQISQKPPQALKVSNRGLRSSVTSENLPTNYVYIKDESTNKEQISENKRGEPALFMGVNKSPGQYMNYSSHLAEPDNDINQSSDIPASIPLNTEESEVPPSYIIQKRSTVCVLKYAYISEKGGLGYILSNRCCGILLNDSSKLIMEANEPNFEYIEKDENNCFNTYRYTFDNYPDILKPKLNILVRFRDYLMRTLDDEGNLYELDAESKATGMVVVEDWLKVQSGIMFKLSNLIVQFDFFDETKLISSLSFKKMIYKNKNQEFKEFLPSESQFLDEETIEKVKMAKDILRRSIKFDPSEKTETAEKEKTVKTPISKSKSSGKKTSKSVSLKPSVKPDNSVNKRLFAKRL